MKKLYFLPLLGFAFAILMTSCNSVKTSFPLNPLTEEEKAIQSKINIHLYSPNNLRNNVVFDVADASGDSSGALITGTNDVRANSDVTILETSTDGHAYAVVYQTFEGGAWSHLDLIVPPGEKDTYLHLYKFIR